MRKRLAGVGLALALCLGCITPVLAADPAAMTDISGHWAEPTIRWSMEQGLFNGTDATAFTPDGVMTRSMFVSVLARMEGVNEEDYKTDYLPTLYNDVNGTEYFAPALNWATRYGIINGMGDGGFHPDEPVSREQMAAIVIRYASNCNYALESIAEGIIPAMFTDEAEISEYALNSVSSLKDTGILTGYSNDDGSFYFGPAQQATRAECATVFSRLYVARNEYTGDIWAVPEALTLTESTVTLERGMTMQLTSVVTPENANNKTVTWVSMNPAVATVDPLGNVRAVSRGSAEIRAYTYNGLKAVCTVECTFPSDLAYAGETYAQKCIRIFGEETDNYRDYYPAGDASHIVTIQIRAWDFKDRNTRTEKVTKIYSLRVHENIAATVQAIFEEIYNGPEQFPIKDVGCYRQEARSEHNVGLAFDINYRENYECRNDGTATVGDYWKPGEDEYSIPRGGDVENAFKKYGFGWGADWRSKKDYMHFSYFGT